MKTATQAETVAVMTDEQYLQFLDDIINTDSAGGLQIESTGQLLAANAHQATILLDYIRAAYGLEWPTPIDSTRQL